MIVVTGASRGLGRAICERLLQIGVPAFGLARNTDGLSFPSHACDVASPESVRAALDAVRSTGAQLEGLINAAGIAAMNLAVFTPPDQAKRIIGTNLLGTIYCCQAFSPLLIRRKSGTIINFSTIAVPLALRGESIYAASKSGIEAYSRVLARELSDFNISVNCISPGPIKTDLLIGVSTDQVSTLVRQQIIQRQFTPADVSDLVEVLLDPRSKSISGQVLHIGGI